MNGPAFVLMGPAHIGALLMIVLVPIVMSWAVRARWLGPNSRVIMGWLFAAVIIINEVVLRVDMLTVAGKTVAQTLPLQLCDIAVYIAVAGVLTRSLTLYELAYFWGFAGTLQALLTPELNDKQGFPSVMFFAFFIQHGGILVGAMYMTWGLNMRPDVHSIVRVFVWCQVYLAVVMPANYLLGTNFGFLMHKPETVSILDNLGDWPWYLAAMQALAVVQFCFWYLPFLYSDWVGLQPLLGRNARPLPGRPLEQPENIWNEIESDTA